jgi:ATP-dependent protease ClpP protease subunit
MATHFIYSTIDSYESYALSWFLEQNKNTDIVIRINSEGGSVDEGITMYNLLKSHNGMVTTVVDGKCHSAAILVFCAGKKRYMNEGTTMLIHPVTADYISDANASDLRKYADTIEQYESVILNIYAKTVGKSEDTLKKLKKLMEQETTLTAEEAAELGFCEVAKQPIYLDKHIVLEYANRAKMMNQKALKELDNYKKREIEELLKDVPDEAKKSIGIVAQNNIEEAKRMKDFILKNTRPSVISRIQKYTNRSEWTLEEWRKKDPAGLEKLKKENPEYFNELLKNLK